MKRLVFFTLSCISFLSFEDTGLACALGTHPEHSKVARAQLELEAALEIRDAIRDQKDLSDEEIEKFKNIGNSISKNPKKWQASLDSMTPDEQSAFVRHENDKRLLLAVQFELRKIFRPDSADEEDEEELRNLNLLEKEQQLKLAQAKLEEACKKQVQITKSQRHSSQTSSGEKIPDCEESPMNLTKSMGGLQKISHTFSNLDAAKSLSDHYFETNPDKIIDYLATVDFATISRTCRNKVKPRFVAKQFKLALESPGGEVTLAFKKGQLVGFTILRQKGSNSVLEALCSAEQGTGLGSFLLGQAEEKSHELGSHLTRLSSVQEATQFYEKKNYSKLGPENAKNLFPYFKLTPRGENTLLAYFVSEKKKERFESFPKNYDELSSAQKGSLVWDYLANEKFQKILKEDRKRIGEVAQWAASTGRVDVLDKLKGQGFPLNEPVEYPLSKKETRQDYLMTLAARSNQTAVLKYLLEMGLDPKKSVTAGHTALAVAVSQGHSESAELLLRSGKSETLDSFPFLSLAVLRGAGPGMIQWLIKNGSDVNIVGIGNRTALDYAVASKRSDATQVIHQLLEAGASPFGSTLDESLGSATPEAQTILLKVRSRPKYLDQRMAQARTTETKRNERDILLALEEPSLPPGSYLIRRTADGNRYLHFLTPDTKKALQTLSLGGEKDWEQNLKNSKIMQDGTLNNPCQFQKDDFEAHCIIRK